MPTSTEKNARFLADRFDIPAEKAAELVANTPAEAEALTRDILHAAHAADALGDVPVPKSGPDLAGDSDEVRLKPVLRGPNKCMGGG